MYLRQGITAFLIGIFMLNAALCPCGPLPVEEIPETASGTVADAHASMGHGFDHDMGHATHDVSMAADTGGMADCHTENAIDECGMTDASDPEAAGKYSDRSLDPARPAPPLGFVAVAVQILSPSAHHEPWRQRPPADTPIRSRDRLLI